MTRLLLEYFAEARTQIAYFSWITRNYSCLPVISMEK